MPTARHTIVAYIRSLGLDVEIVPRGQGWSRLFISLPQKDACAIGLPHILFKDGEFSHSRIYISDGQITPMDYYRAAIELYIRTGVELDSVAFSDLKYEAEQMARDNYAMKVQYRNDAPKRKRKKLSPPNPSKYLRELLMSFNAVTYENTILELTERESTLDTLKYCLLGVLMRKVISK